MDFISHNALIKAMHDWTLAKASSLSDILVENGSLDPADRAVLESLVERHVARATEATPKRACRLSTAPCPHARRFWCSTILTFR